MQSCSITKHIKLTRGDINDYHHLSRYHYRQSPLRLFKAIYRYELTGQTIGVIVYTMPPANLELRNIATGHIFTGLDRKTQLALINSTIRNIARVIIDPRFRGLGLAAQLVKQTMPLLDVPIIEAQAVMGHFNPFFEKAGMSPIHSHQSAHAIQLIEALSFVGIETELFCDELTVHRIIENLPPKNKRFLEHQIQKFLHAFGQNHPDKPGLERTRYILSKLSERPIYYIWFNPKFKNSPLSPITTKTIDNTHT